MSDTHLLDKRERYLDAGPYNAHPLHVARWLVALAMRRDGRADAVVRGDEIVDGAPMDFRALHERERGAVAVALYVASTSLAWPTPRIAEHFGLDAEFVADVVAATAEGIVNDGDFRAGFLEIGLTVRKWLASVGLH